MCVRAGIRTFRLPPPVRAAEIGHCSTRLPLCVRCAGATANCGRALPSGLWTGTFRAAGLNAGAFSAGRTFPAGHHAGNVVHAGLLSTLFPPYHGLVTRRLGRKSSRA